MNLHQELYLARDTLIFNPSVNIYQVQVKQSLFCGTILLTIRYGNKIVELEKGKNAIELLSKAELEPTLQSVKKAVDEGEFDRLLEEQLAYGSRLTKQ